METLVGIGTFIIALVLALVILFIGFFITGLCLTCVEDIASNIRYKKYKKARR